MSLSKNARRGLSIFFGTLGGGALLVGALLAVMSAVIAGPFFALGAIIAVLGIAVLLGGVASWPSDREKNSVSEKKVGVGVSPVQSGYEPDRSPTFIYNHPSSVIGLGLNNPYDQKKSEEAARVLAATGTPQYENQFGSNSQRGNEF